MSVHTPLYPPGDEHEPPLGAKVARYRSFYLRARPEWPGLRLVEVFGQMVDVTPGVGDPAHDDPDRDDPPRDDEEPPERDAQQRRREPGRQQHRLDARTGEVDLLSGRRDGRVERAHET